MFFLKILVVKTFKSQRRLFRKTFFDEIDEFIPYPSEVATDQYHAKGLANGRLIFFFPYFSDRTNEFLYLFHSNEWKRSAVEISDDDEKIFLQCDKYLHILSFKNLQTDR